MENVAYICHTVSNRRHSGRGNWMETRQLNSVDHMKNILITGGTGFFGKSLLDYRLRHPNLLSDANITILSRDSEKFIRENALLSQQPRVTFITGDIRDFNIDTGDIDIIIHAATSAVTTIQDEEQTSVIVDGTRHVIEVAKAHHTQRLLFTSSGAVYGPQTIAVDECAPCNPITAYGKGKLLAEQLLVKSGIPTLIARCFAFTGPHLNRKIHYAIGNFIQNCLDGKPIVINGDGTPRRSYLYADDLVEWLFALLERGLANRPYNIGSPIGLSIRELAEEVRKTLKCSNEIIVRGNRNDDSPISAYVPIVNRAMDELGVTVNTTLQDAILKSV